ncbi:CBS domain-containing protein [Acidianus hospitalis]|jgi:signal-transduction protein with cAMP-binding, CBS, and nucleotidyltransferase domain|uniref:CBS domain-containing protein n=2 Tax=Acidianus hospitalis TaxID=563177 RepID=A0A2T9X3E4_9CREN|nr:CBS domain-containing protein [Acidianus hospitalis]AEE95149.1 putative signal-transduction protein with CBS domains [Acidianus hospitalis W1]MDT7900599.1 CBS domain-containing protein [Acidianus sp.]PVU74582.1 CBS domain-containing protein [Acidianus hospitalis]
MSIKELITRPPVTISSSASLKDCAKLMRKENVGSLLVVDGDTPKGIITERDIIQAIADDYPLETPASKVMSTNLITADASTEVGDAALLMTNHKIRHLVVTEGGKIIGVISLRDVARSLGLITTDASFW